VKFLYGKSIAQGTGAMTDGLGKVQLQLSLLGGF
jgi:hypothetical protein